MARLIYLAIASVDGYIEVMRDFAQIWRGADKIVYSKTLESASTART